MAGTLRSLFGRSTTKEDLVSQEVTITFNEKTQPITIEVVKLYNSILSDSVIYLQSMNINFNDFYISDSDKDIVCNATVVIVIHTVSNSLNDLEISYAVPSSADTRVCGAAYAFGILMLSYLRTLIQRENGSLDLDLIDMSASVLSGIFSLYPRGQLVEIHKVGSQMAHEIASTDNQNVAKFRENLLTMIIALLSQNMSEKIIIEDIYSSFSHLLKTLLQSLNK